jgi:hypothetical protein
MTPPGGPYCSIGRKIAFVVGDGAGGLGSLIVNIVASKTCGSTVMVTDPTLIMLSLGGFFGSSYITPFLLYGLVQYFSKMPSLIHFCRDRPRDSDNTPLRDFSHEQRCHRNG